MKKTSSIITIATIFIAFVAINLLAARHPIRLDLTDNNLYTLSKSTKTMLNGLSDVVTAKLYFTGDLPPSLQPLRTNVDDVLAEFKHAAKGNFQIQFTDPSASAMEEQKAQMLGIPPVQLNVFDKDKQEVAKIYLGLAIVYGDKQQVIPVIRNAENLEYEIAEAILKVTTPVLPSVGWLDIGGIAQAGIDFSFARDGLSRRYDLKIIGEKDIANISPDKISVLIVASPKNLESDALNAIDSFLAGGGKLAVFADSVVMGQTLNAIEENSDLITRLSKYGITVENTFVLDQTSAMASFSGGPVTYHIPYPLWPDIRKSQFNQKDPISAELETVVFPWTSPIVLSKESEAEGRATPLAFSSAVSCSVTVKDAKLDPQSTADMLARCEKQPQILAAIVDVAASEKTTGADDEKTKTSTGKIFVTGSSRWISDGYLQTFPANAALFENAIDALTLQDMLIDVRSKENSSRPIVQLSDFERTFFRYVNLVLGPALALCGGLIFFLLRKRRIAALRKRYA